jgi:hypothetical protein
MRLREDAHNFSVALLSVALGTRAGSERLAGTLEAVKEPERLERLADQGDSRLALSNGSCGTRLGRGVDGCGLCDCLRLRCGRGGPLDLNGLGSLDSGNCRRDCSLLRVCLRRGSTFGLGTDRIIARKGVIGERDGASLALCTARDKSDGDAVDHCC